MSENLRLRNTDLEWREVEGEVVALDLQSSNYLAVNPSGAKLWTVLASGATRGQLIDVLVTEFGVSREQAVSETDTFIRMLADQDLLLEE